VDKIIKGQSPGDIPVESNPRIQFAINLKVANQLGLRISQEMLSRADQVFQ
jgi:putative ABC transport system substrate-binding protein